MLARPVGARYVGWAASACLVAMFVAVGVLLPDEIRATFTPFQTLTLLACLGATIAVLLGIGRSRVSTDDEGVHVRNGYRTHHVPWDEIAGVSFRGGAPWATLVRHDGGRYMLIGVQGSDGEVARRAVRELTAELAARR